MLPADAWNLVFEYSLQGDRILRLLQSLWPGIFGYLAYRRALERADWLALAFRSARYDLLGDLQWALSRCPSLPFRELMLEAAAHGSIGVGGLCLPHTRTKEPMHADDDVFNSGCYHPDKRFVCMAASRGQVEYVDWLLASYSPWQQPDYCGLEHLQVAATCCYIAEAWRHVRVELKPKHVFRKWLRGCWDGKNLGQYWMHQVISYACGVRGDRATISKWRDLKVILRPDAVLEGAAKAGHRDLVRDLLSENTAVNLTRVLFAIVLNVRVKLPGLTTPPAAETLIWLLALLPGQPQQVIDDLFCRTMGRPWMATEHGVGLPLARGVSQAGIDLAVHYRAAQGDGSAVDFLETHCAASQVAVVAARDVLRDLAAAPATLTAGSTRKRKRKAPASAFSRQRQPTRRSSRQVQGESKRLLAERALHPL